LRIASEGWGEAVSTGRFFSRLRMRPSSSSMRPVIFSERSMAKGEVGNVTDSHALAQLGANIGAGGHKPEEG
jgi:hypothetical protein